MDKLIDKIIIFMVCLTLYAFTVDHKYMVIPILTIIIISALLSYFENHKIVLGIYLAFEVICFYEPSFLFFIPLICYDIMLFQIKWIWPLALLPLIINCAKSFSFYNLLIAMVVLISYILKIRTTSLQNIRKRYYEFQYHAKEMSINLESKNKSLIEKQDYEINLATLNERNRIARDIHDNVGHMLSRSILQVGALLAVNKDENTKESLYLIRDTLKEAMGTIRNSVHNLHEESIDLETEIQKLIDNMESYSINFDYSIETSLRKDIKYCFISVIKEALANTIKHSDATKITIAVIEHPGFYQLVVKDNGTKTRFQDNIESDKPIDDIIDKGIGLKNIEDRVKALGGNVNISFAGGFRIFISIPK